MKKTGIITRVSAILVLMMAGSLIVWAVKSGPKRHAQPVKKIIKADVKTYDPVLLKKFDMLAASLDLNKACSYSGVLRIQDKADSVNSIKETEFACCKDKNDCYLKIGQTETINAHGFYLVVDHAGKKVMIGPQKTVSIATSPMAGLSKFRENLLSENYALTSKKDAKTETIIFENNRHRSCKQYSMTYDTVDMRVMRIVARLTDLRAPLDMNMDRVIDMRFFDWSGKADFKKYLQYKSVFHIKNNQFILTDEYRDYELIRL